MMLGLIALFATGGCSTMAKLGFKSAGRREAERLLAEKQQFVKEGAETKARLVALDDRQKRMQSELKTLRAQLASRQAEKPKKEASKVTQESPQERLARLRRALGGRGIPTGTGVRLSGDILFRSGSVEVRSAARPTLAGVANALKSVGPDVVVFVDGHTDSDPLRRTKALYKDNYNLGLARAESVARELAKRDVPRSRLVIRSFGQDRPIASNKTAAGKKQNRRVEISLAFADTVAHTAGTR